MALNPNIALALKTPEPFDPLATYGKIAAIQQAQNQNALAQYQLATAKREDEATNALNAAYREAYDSTTGKIDVNKLRQSVAGAGYGTKLPGIEKTLGELERQRADLAHVQATTTKTQGEILDAVVQRYRDAIGQIDPNSPTAGARLLAAHEANHSNPAMAEYLKTMGVNAADSRKEIDAAIAQGPQGIAQFIARSSLKSKEFQDANRPHWVSAGGQMVPVGGLTGQPIAGVQPIAVTNTPAQTAEQNAPHWINLGNKMIAVNKSTGLPIPGIAPQPINMTPGEAARLDQEKLGVTYHTDENGIIVALPSKLKPGEVPTARTAIAPGGGMQPLGAKPSEAETKERGSISQQQAIVNGALNAVKSSPGAFGLGRGLMGETLGVRTGTDQERQDRAYVFNVVSGVIKERAGTAQSAAEAETLSRFLPQPTDNAQIIEDKLTAFQRYLTDKQSGMKPKKGAPSAKPAATSSTPSLPPGFKLD